MKIHRRHFAGTLCFTPVFTSLLSRTASAQDAPVAASVRGTLEAPSELRAGLRLSDGSFVELHGDEQTTKVLHDERLSGMDFEVRGRRLADGRFNVLPIHLAALFTHVGGTLMRVTSYCDVCAIRTYSPSVCMCCREETRVDIVDPASITKSATA